MGNRKTLSAVMGAAKRLYRTFDISSEDVDNIRKYIDLHPEVLEKKEYSSFDEKQFAIIILGLINGVDLLGFGIDERFSCLKILTFHNAVYYCDVDCKLDTSSGEFNLILNPEFSYVKIDKLMDALKLGLDISRLVEIEGIDKLDAILNLKKVFNLDDSFILDDPFLNKLDDEKLVYFLQFLRSGYNVEDIMESKDLEFNGWDFYFSQTDQLRKMADRRKKRRERDDV